MFIDIIAKTVSKVMNFKGTLDKTQPHHTCISYTTISTTKISYTKFLFKKSKCIHQNNKWLCAKKTQHPLRKSARTSTKIYYIGTKENDNLKIWQPLANLETPSSQFLVILNIIPRILNLNPYISSTKK